MNIVVVYVYPQLKLRLYYPLAKRFAESWQRFPPHTDHQLYVVLNGGDASLIDRAPFNDISCQMVVHSNLGWDVGAYQMIAQSVECDLLICLGAPAHFHKPNWMEKMVEAYLINGPGLYGCWAYLTPNWHVRTTIFWVHPQLLNSYPFTVTNSRASRYEFEHGNKSFTRHVMKSGFGCYMVTQTACFPFDQWRNNVPGPQESLVLDQFTFDPKISNLKMR